MVKPQNDKETARLVRRLVGAGFSFNIISILLKNWGIDLSEADLVVPEDGPD
jgi:SOS response regulatory protein OraA/RecX